MMHAALLAPDAVLLPVDFDAYRRYSRLFKAAVRAIAPRIEDRGIDEIYIDLTNVAAPAGLRALAQSLKDAVRVATALAASIGIAENKLLAKIASDLDKPDGLTVIGDGDLERRIWPLPARRINGIGPKSAARLAELQIHTIGDLARAGREVLVERFGRAQGQWMHESSHGRDGRDVVTCSEPRSISRETTFERDLSVKRDRELLSGVFTDLCTGVGDDLRRKGYAGRTVGVKLRYDNFVIVTRDRTIAAPTQDALEIRRAAGACLRRVALDRRIRLLGVRMSGLVRPRRCCCTRQFSRRSSDGVAVRSRCVCRRMSAPFAMSSARNAGQRCHGSPRRDGARSAPSAAARSTPQHGRASATGCP